MWNHLSLLLDGRLGIIVRFHQEPSRLSLPCTVPLIIDDSFWILFHLTASFIIEHLWWRDRTGVALFGRRLDAFIQSIGSALEWFNIPIKGMLLLLFQVLLLITQGTLLKRWILILPSRFLFFCSWCSIRTWSIVIHPVQHEPGLLRALQNFLDCNTFDLSIGNW